MDCQTDASAGCSACQDNSVACELHSGSSNFLHLWPANKIRASGCKSADVKLQPLGRNASLNNDISLVKEHKKTNSCKVNQIFISQAPLQAIYCMCNYKTCDLQFKIYNLVLLSACFYHFEPNKHINQTQQKFLGIFLWKYIFSLET